MSMVELALTAELPLIAVHTRDTINMQDILQHFVGGEGTIGITEKHPGKSLKAPEYKYILMGGVEIEVEKYYHWAVKHDVVLIFVNLPKDEEHPLIFDAGVVPTPKVLVVRMLSSLLNDDDIKKIMPTLGGLTLKDIGEVCRLAMTMMGDLSPRSVMEIRRLYATKLPGIEQVDLYSSFYIPDNSLKTWSKKNSKFFLNSPDPRLTPRGLLAGGPPGTGKTEAAKYLAREWNVPLYRLDIASMMNKWLGEAEGNLKNALAQIEQEAPCVLLIDEVEKLFQQGDSDSGATSRMLSQLLWWLQAHRKQILSLMTTNNIDVLPPELYRPGRVDETITFHGVAKKNVPMFMERILFSLEDNADLIVSMDKAMSVVGMYLDGKKKLHFPQSDLVQLAYDIIKTQNQ